MILFIRKPKNIKIIFKQCVLFVLTKSHFGLKIRGRLLTKYCQTSIQSGAQERHQMITNCRPLWLVPINPGLPGEKMVGYIRHAEICQHERKKQMKKSSRSAAAVKAWKTRRKNAADREAMLSDRARKAWETRRANGWVHPASR